MYVTMSKLTNEPKKVNNVSRIENGGGGWEPQPIVLRSVSTNFCSTFVTHAPQHVVPEFCWSDILRLAKTYQRQLVNGWRRRWGT